MHARGNTTLLQQGPARSFPRAQRIPLGMSVLILLSNQLPHQRRRAAASNEERKLKSIFTLPSQPPTSFLYFHSPSNKDDLHALPLLLLLFSHLLLLCTKGIAQEKWRFHAPVNARTHHSIRRTRCCFHNPDHASSTLLFPITPSAYP